jgi:hypothetical protein
MPPRTGNANLHHETGDIFGEGNRGFPTADQYTIQGDEFSKAVLEGGDVPVPLEDWGSMAVIKRCSNPRNRA